MRPVEELMTADHPAWPDLYDEDDLGATSRRPVPIAEIFSLNQDLEAQLSGLPDGASVRVDLTPLPGGLPPGGRG